MKSTRASASMGKGGKKKSKSKSQKKHVHEMSIRHSANGGYIAKHSFKPGADGMPQEPEEHALPDMDSLASHVQDNMQPQPGAMPQPQAGPPQAVPVS